MAQQFLITVQRMCTSDEADIVSGWSAVVEEDDLPKITLATAAEATLLTLKDCPGTNIRPMTEAEIATWRYD
jgi:hypothetical protein